MHVCVWISTLKSNPSPPKKNYWLNLTEQHESFASDLVQPLGDRQEILQNSVWAPPHSGLCKINVDGALFPTKKLAGIGVVIRDQQGRLLAALCRKIRAQMGALEVEAKAYEAGVLLARHLGLRNGVLEGDSVTVSMPSSRLYSLLLRLQPLWKEFMVWVRMLG